MLEILAYPVFRGRVLLHTVLDVVDDGPVSCRPASHPLHVSTLARVARELATR